MTFDENGICVLESITHPCQCDAYRDFLMDEWKRHVKAWKQATKRVARFRWTAAWMRVLRVPNLQTYYLAAGLCVGSAATRHQQDIDAIAKRLLEIAAHKAKLGGK